MTSIHVELSGLKKRFGDVTAVGGVDLAVPEGSFVTLLGPSGCGKTTTLRLIAGFYDPDEGEMRIGGRRINDLPPDQRNTAMVFQDFALFPHMTVFENIAYGLRMRGQPNAEISRRVEETARLLGLAGMERKWPLQLSGGQQQRVALARALIVEPEVLLLDEPLSNLDAKLRIRVRTEIRQIQQQLGKTTIYVTHDQEEALSISDTIAVMAAGRIVQVGTPYEVYYTPASRFVADFVGIANFVEGRVVRDGGAAGVEAGGAVLEMGTRDLRAGSAVLLAIRPEAVRLLEPGVSLEGKNVLRGVVTASSFMGSLARYWIEAMGTEWVVDVHMPVPRKLLAGEVVLQIPGERIHVLEQR
ncbi:MAG: ABC transporter ATP-binding protein [Armatimonadetes bacterium]|nr:ABC transporter ATP-binding protein [Armatimonadota bacterium]